MAPKSSNQTVTSNSKIEYENGYGIKEWPNGNVTVMDENQRSHGTWPKEQRQHAFAHCAALRAANTHSKIKRKRVLANAIDVHIEENTENIVDLDPEELEQEPA